MQERSIPSDDPSGRSEKAKRNHPAAQPVSALEPGGFDQGFGALAAAAIDALQANIAVLDAGGNILTVNRAWREFASSNGALDRGDFLGHNYIEVCEQSAGGAAAAAGIRSLLDGNGTGFYLEYPCHHGPGERWFGMKITRLSGHPIARLLIAHEEITDRKLAERALLVVHAELDARVRDRTKELAAINRELREQIEERRSSDAALRESNERLRLALRAGMMGTWQIDIATNEVTRSDSVDLLFGLTPGGRSRPLADYLSRMHPDDVPRVIQTLKHGIEGGTEQYVEYRVVLPSGETRWIASRGEILKDADGTVPLFSGASMDVTQRKLVEEALRDSEERYRLLFESNPHSMWVYDVATFRFIAVNDSAVQFYGYSRAEFLAMTIHDIRPPEDVAKLKEFLATHWNVSDARGIWRHCKRDGTIITVEVISHTISFAGVKARLILATDVTDRLLAEEGLLRAHLELEQRVEARTAELARTNDALRESEELFRQIAENIGEVFWMTNTDKHTMIYVSPAYETIWGHSCESLYLKPSSFLDAIIAEDRDKVLANLPQQALGETTTTYRIKAGDGTLHWIRDRSFPIRNRSGNIYRIAGIAENITDLKKTEEELSRLVSIAESSDDAIVGKTLDGTIISWNSGARRIYGYRAEEVIGKSAKILFPPEQQAEPIELLAKLARGEQVASVETTRLRRNGERFSVSLTLSAVRDAEGHVIAASAIERDITERKRLEREILEIGERERQRIGRDLHDGLGQHLTGIAFLSKALQQQLMANQRPEANDAGQIAELVQQAIGQTRALARGLHPVQESPAGLMSALQEMANRVEAMFRVTCEMICPRPVPLSDNNVATHLYRIAQEAVNNAIKHGAARHIKLCLEGGRGVVLRIEDNGCGFDRSTIKEGETPVDLSLPDKCGMGLRIMRYRAGMIGATISVSAGQKGGTVVTCSLPPRAKAASRAAGVSNIDGDADGYQRSSKQSGGRSSRSKRGSGQGPGTPG